MGSSFAGGLIHAPASRDKDLDSLALLHSYLIHTLYNPFTLNNINIYVCRSVLALLSDSVWVPRLPVVRFTVPPSGT